MQSRIPLSIVLSAEGRRHAIPHRTFRIPVSPSPPDAAATPEQRECFAFFRYLDSNDTRLPSHPHLSAYAQPAEDYETYVGEDDWQCEPTPSEAVGSAVPAFRTVVDWVHGVLEEETWAADGVVLCGRYVVADDGAWVVPSRSPTLFSTREVFMLMRNSCKFLEDVHTQMKALRGTSATHLEFTLAKSLAGSDAGEMRAILPYALHFAPATQQWAITEDTAASLSFTGIGQRVTDACFPSLMAWSEEEHDVNYRCMHRRVEQAALLERTREADPHFISRLVEQFHKRRCTARRLPTLSSSPTGALDDANDAATPPPPQKAAEEHLALLLTVDLLFEGPSLPLYILSAKARVYAVLQPTDAAWADAMGTAAGTNTATSMGQLWVPLLKAAEPESGVAGTTTDTSLVPPSAAAVGEATAGPSPTPGCGSAAPEEEPSDGDDDSEEDDGDDVAAALNFFRMFRDVEHWNQYVAVMLRRLHEAAAAADASASADSNKPSREVRHYCVIASDGGDLVTCADKLTKRGLPLELTHPELLELNGEAAGFLKMLRDGLFKALTD